MAQMKYYLAIDIGASSGRHVLGHMKGGELVTEEVYRFPNGVAEKNGRLCWDLDALFEEILSGLRRCAEIGKIPASVGIDTWGVDFVLLEVDGNILGDTVSYRDSRTDGMDVEVYKHISELELYSRTGIPRQMFNTIFQLMAVKKTGLLERAKTMLMIPDYLHYRLCGVAKTEYSIASTTGLLNAHTGQWDDEVINACGYPRDMFLDIIPPGTVLGGLTPEIRAQVGFNVAGANFTTKVVVPPTHDTAAAVLAVPSDSAKAMLTTAPSDTAKAIVTTAPSDSTDALFISSGTWSVMGVVRQSPDCSEESMQRNFANEGGYGPSIIYLKNIMGLWMIQSVKKELGDTHTFAELCELAKNETIFSIVDCNNSRFFSPKSMINEIRQACDESGQPIPETPGELAAVIYRSLAKCYHNCIQELEQITGVTYSSICIIGGGVNASYLNELTAHYAKKPVITGPVEATAIGNILAQMKAVFIP